ncbi:MAG: PEP-CTERM sorting domain-containing protein [Planctomycetes bacterium]|jgi:hypothetical protein|nr:PEP-CTERM sorting domain-containing protein [Planctomycetota bacterium]
MLNKCLVLLCMLCLCASASVAAIKGFDTAEGQVLGTPLKTSGYIYSYGADDGVIANDQIFAGDQSLKVDFAAYRSFGGRFDVVADPGNRYLYSGAVRLTASTHSLTAGVTALRYGSNAHVAPVMVYQNGTEARVTYNTAAGSTTIALTRSQVADQWLVIETLLNNNDGTYSFKLFNADKTQTLASASDGVFAGGVMVGNPRYAIYTDTGSLDTVVHFDSLKAIPEPGCLSLLGLGAIGLLKKRRTL